MKPLVIQAPNKGIAQSPHVGYGDVRNLDIFTIPGIARLSNLLEKKSSTTVTNLPLWFEKNPNSPDELFALDAGGQVYTSTNNGGSWSTVAGETAGGSGQGMKIWKDYLFVARASALDVYGPLSSSPSWSNSWKTIDSDNTWHPMVVSYNDGNLYGGAGRYIFSLSETSGSTFAPGTPSTYDFTQQALDLPSGYRIKCLAEQGDYLHAGTWMGTNIYDFKVADIFPWDRSSPSFGSPVRIAENGVNMMFNADGALFVMAGTDGKIFQSNGAQAFQIAQIPNSIANLDGGYFLNPLPGAVMHYKGRIFFGLANGSATNVDGVGVWSLVRTSSGTVLNLEHGISTGSFGSSSTVKIGALLPTSRDTFIAGWGDASTYGIDKASNSLRVTSYGGYFDSPFYAVGTPLVKRQFTQCDIQLAAALTTGQGIRLKYRTDLSASFTTMRTFDYATYGGVISDTFTTDIPDCENIQIRCELTTGASNTTPQIKDIILS